jgi:hypothetical protein
MLVKETPERIGAVFAELPLILVDRIKSYLPPELQSQASESQAEEIKSEKSQTVALRLRLSTLLPQNHSHLVAHFRVSLGALGDGRERARKLTTRWLRASDSKFRHTS